MGKALEIVLVVLGVVVLGGLVVLDWIDFDWIRWLRRGREDHDGRP